MNIHFLIYCECGEFWWSNAKFIPRVGEIVEDGGTEFKVIEVKYNYKQEPIITVDRI